MDQDVRGLRDRLPARCLGTADRADAPVRGQRFTFRRQRCRREAERGGPGPGRTFKPRNRPRRAEPSGGGSASVFCSRATGSRPLHTHNRPHEGFAKRSAEELDKWERAVRMSPFAFPLSWVLPHPRPTLTGSAPASRCKRLAGSLFRSQVYRSSRPRQPKSVGSPDLTV